MEEFSDLPTTNLRQRRLRQAIPLRPVAPVEESADTAARTAPKLTKTQRAILIRLIAQLHYVDAVREALAEEYPDYPQISDELIRYYRRQITAEESAEVKAARADALKTGLANKTIRVNHLIRQAETLRRVPLVSMDKETKSITGVRLDIAREIRETLNQIARELGQLPLATPAGAAGIISPIGDDEPARDLTADEEEQRMRADLEELLRGMAERDRETEAALAAARRPEQTTTQT